MKIQGQTYFDCTYTGTTGHFRASQIPFADRAGQNIASEQDWMRSRNQQRNWETIQQMISLRAQPTVTKYPYQQDEKWWFEFEVDSDGVYSSDGTVDNIDMLSLECSGIPMILNLGETTAIEPRLVVSGSQQNIWFKKINN